MKRFTETGKWNDPWFRSLGTNEKLLWLWLVDNCDNAGVIDPDMGLASFQIGYAMGIDTLSSFGDRLTKLQCGKWLIRKFVSFQNGERLSRDCKAHNPIFQSLERHGVGLEEIGYAKGMGKGIDTPQAAAKEKEKEKEGGCKGDSEIKIEMALKWLKAWRDCGADYTEAETRSAFLALQANGWMWGKNKVADPRAAIERQIQTDRSRRPAQNGRAAKAEWQAKPAGGNF